MQVTTQTGNLTTWATDINHHHELACLRAGEAINHAIEAGKLLLKVKARLPHGELGRWMQSNLKVTERQAQRYMAAAQGKPVPVRAIAANTTPESVLPAPAPSAEHESEMLKAANQTIGGLQTELLITQAMQCLKGDDRIASIEAILTRNRLHAEIEKATLERDNLMNERAEMMRCLNAQRREIKKLREAEDA